MNVPPIADALNAFVSRWNLDHSSSDVGALRHLAERTRAADPNGRGVPADTIARLVRRRSATTELRIADAIVQALGRTDMFYDGTLEIRPNPSAPRAARAACCGSLTGAATLRR